MPPDVDQFRESTSKDPGMPSAEQSRVVIGWNPGSGSGSRLDQIESLTANLSNCGFDVRASTSIDEATEWTTSAHDRGTLRAFVAAGGDGTIRTMAERLPAGVPIAIYPMGTENLLAKHFGLTSDEREVISAIQEGTDYWMDAGMAGDRMFLVMVTCGFDAEVVRRLHASRRGNIHRSTWLLPIWNSLFHYRFPKLQVTTDGGQPFSSARWAFVFNVPRYALDLKFAPDADPTDGMLDVLTFQRGGLFNGLAYLVAVLSGRHRRQPSVRFRRAATVSIRSDSQVPFQIDGDPGGELPVTISVVPRRVRLRLPHLPGDQGDRS